MWTAVVSSSEVLSHVGGTFCAIHFDNAAAAARAAQRRETQKGRTRASDATHRHDRFN